MNLRGLARGFVLAATTVALAAGAAPAQAPTSRRALVPADRAQRMEALLARAYPGATLDWDREQLVYPDGRRVAFTFAFYRERPRAGEVFAVASPAPDPREAEALRRLGTFRTPAEDLPRCKLSLMRTDAAGAVLGYKETGIDLPDLPSTCGFVNFNYAHLSAGLQPPSQSGRAEPVWPLVLINYSTLHTLPDAWATITWAAVLDTDTLAWISRLPVSFQAMRRDRRRAAFVIMNDRGSGGGGAWVFNGLTGGDDQPSWQVRVPCRAGSCKVEPQAVLDGAFQSPAWK